LKRSERHFSARGGFDAKRLAPQFRAPQGKNSHIRDFVAVLPVATLHPHRTLGPCFDA
jgi:hypothetical protein